MKQPLLADRYPARDGAEIEREAMSRDDVRLAAARLKAEAAEAYSRAYELEAWWRSKRRAERAWTGLTGKNSARYSRPPRNA
jgi:hypothetical protein